MEEECDRVAVRSVNLAAFQSPFEADLVDILREHASPVVSLVAEEDEDIVGHIMFSPVSLTGHPGIRAMGLGPVAVAPHHQRTGIGTRLVQTGLEHCRQRGFHAAVVLGHPEYYPRFGFLPSSRYGISSDFNVPEPVFMALELQPDSLSGRTGTIKYHPAFSGKS